MGVVGSKNWKPRNHYNSTTNLHVSNERLTVPRSSSLCHLSKSHKPDYAKAIRENRKYRTHVGNGTIEVCFGDITKQKVDAIAISSSSDNLRDYVLKKAGDSVKQVYESQNRQQADKCIYTNGGNLACKKIYFIPCPKLSADSNKWTFRNFIKDVIRIAANDRSTNIQSLALPAIGCGLVGFDPNFVAKTLIMAVVYELEHQSSLRLHVSFVIQNNQQNIFNSFCNQLATLEKQKSQNIIRKPPIVPPHLAVAKPAPHPKNPGFIVEKRQLAEFSKDYKMVIQKFTSTMNSTHYSTILRIELVWNPRWYKEYKIHAAEFSQRLQQNTERRLFHGCPETAANSIINECFDRSHAGENGTAYGHGSYFSSKASYSHSFATPNLKGERCMFLAKVLIGKTTIGNSSMKHCPPGYDSTTDGSHIYVVYHDSQAFGKYLITYK